LKVREVIRALEAGGWRLARTRGDHRQYHHPEKPGTVTVPGSLGHEMPMRDLASIARQAGLPIRDLQKWHR